MPRVLTYGEDGVCVLILESCASSGSEWQVLHLRSRKHHVKSLLFLSCSQPLTGMPRKTRPLNFRSRSHNRPNASPVVTGVPLPYGFWFVFNLIAYCKVWHLCPRPNAVDRTHDNSWLVQDVPRCLALRPVYEPSVEHYTTGGAQDRGFD